VPSRRCRAANATYCCSALADLSHIEVAEALGISYGTVGSRLNRARTKLREALGGTNPMHALEERSG
jgi:predicted DNA-binding protein (UPF0251 family)